tara:strand:+ start:653 stop:1231 length:579 start_codon:yes stop_codon:yes gene_type:complete
MRGLQGFLVKPKGERYNNIKKVGDKELILNAEISNYEFLNREAIVKSTPLAFETDIQKGDTVIIHHNVFRRWYNVKGIEKNSSSFIDEDNYIVYKDQIFAYKRKDEWKAMDGFCFIKPLKEDGVLNVNKEKLIGIVKHTDGTVDQGSLVRFKPVGQYEFIIDGERLYRVKSNLITLKYEYQGNEKEYNPSWA